MNHHEHVRQLEKERDAALARAEAAEKTIADLSDDYGDLLIVSNGHESRLSEATALLEYYLSPLNGEAGYERNGNFERQARAFLSATPAQAAEPEHNPEADAEHAKLVGVADKLRECRAELETQRLYSNNLIRVAQLDTASARAERDLFAERARELGRGQELLRDAIRRAEKRELEACAEADDLRAERDTALAAAAEYSAGWAAERQAHDACRANLLTALARIAELEALFQSTHNCHYSWVANHERQRVAITRAVAELENMDNMSAVRCKRALEALR